MKTIKEVSEAAGVSKTSIYNLINKNDIPTLKREGKTYVDENSENLILSYYSTEQLETLKDIVVDTKSSVDSEQNQEYFQDEFQDSKDNQQVNQDIQLIEYRRLIGILEKELNKNDKIIQGLLESNKALTQTLATEKINEAARLMIKDNQYDNRPTGAEVPKGFLKRIFRKK